MILIIASLLSFITYAQRYEKKCLPKGEVQYLCDSEGVMDHQCDMYYVIKDPKTKQKIKYISRRVLDIDLSHKIGKEVLKHTLKNKFCIIGDNYKYVDNPKLLTFIAIKAGSFCESYFEGDCKYFKQMKNRDRIDLEEEP